MAAVVDLSDGVDALRRLTNRYIELIGRDDRAEKPFGIYYLSPKSEFAPLARFVEREVFDAAFGNDDSTMDHEYDLYEAASLFVLVVDHSRREPAGALRAIRPSGVGHKTIRDLGSIPDWSVTFDEISEFHGGVAADRLWDIATLAVRADWAMKRERSRVSAALYHGVYTAMLMAGAAHWVCALDERVARLLRLAETPLQRVCDLPSIEYLGSPSTGPYIVDMADCSVVARTGGPRARKIIFGEGLAAEFSFPPVDLREGVVADPADLESQGELVGTGVPDAVATGGPVDVGFSGYQSDPARARG